MQTDTVICSSCGSTAIEIVEQYDEDDRALKDYYECNGCGNAWEVPEDELLGLAQ